jgi:prepilin-type N-terminal cleavage/methylation domain-containing protein
MTFNKKRGGFTLIELLVVIAILATIAGGILVSYDGLEADAAQGQATFNIGAVDRAVRTYNTLNKAYPNNLDSLLFSPGETGTDAVALNLLNSKIRGKIGLHTLVQGGVDALTAAGITQLRYVGGIVTSEGAGKPAVAYNNTTMVPQIPNRIFDNRTRGWGIPVAVASGVKVAVMETPGITLFDPPSTPAAISSRLRDIAGMDENQAHLVVVLGLGNTSTMVAESAVGTVTGTLSEAPYYTNLAKTQYGRFLLLFHIASAPLATPTDYVYLSQARFIGAIDTKGDWLEEEYAEFTNQKQ